MEVPLVWALVILIIIVILYKMNLRQLHSKLKPVQHDDGNYSADEVKKNGQYWDDKFGDHDKVANYIIVALALGVMFVSAQDKPASAEVPVKSGGSPIVMYSN
jgi:hypothetical protein